MKLIVCPLDFSAASLNAVHFAAAMLRDTKACILLLHVYEDPEKIVGRNPANKDSSGIRAALEKKLNAVKRELETKFSGLNFQNVLKRGAGSRGIVSLAARHHADMIVMGATGTSKLTRLITGSTTSKVIRDATCPVLCVPAAAAFKGIHKIVFATDLQEDNILAANTLSSFAKYNNAEIVFVFVNDRHLLHDEKDILKMTKKIRQNVRYPKISGFVSEHTNVSKGLEQFLKKYPGDLLVMFTHPRHFPDSFFNQSMTRLMSHQAQIPLLAIRHLDRPVDGKVN